MSRRHRASAYDKNGQMVSRTRNGATTRYAYDFEGRLTSSGNVGYERDALGRVASTKRLATPLATNPTGGSFEPKSFLYDGSEAAQETDQAGTPTYLTRGLGGGITNRRVGATGSPSYFHHDKNGSVVTLTGSTGAKTDTYSYDGFGNFLSRTGTTKNSYLYLENSFEPSTGLYDAHARAYDPKNGRFTSEDPVKGVSSLPETLNPYPCSINNPISYPDPGGAFSLSNDMLERIVNYQGGGDDSSDFYLNGRVEKTQTMPRELERRPCNAQNFITESVNPPFQDDPYNGQPADYVAGDFGYVTRFGVGGSFRVTVDRNGGVYAGGGSVVGTPGYIADMVGGHYNRRSTRAGDFLPGRSVAVGGGGPDGSTGKVAVVGEGTATEFGASYSPGANYTCSWTSRKLFNVPVRW